MAECRATWKPRPRGSRRWTREGVGLLLLASACGAASTHREAELEEVFTLTAAAPTTTFETTYCLEELHWQTVAVSATFSVTIDAPEGRTVTLGLVDTEDGESGESGGNDENGESGESGGSEPAADVSKEGLADGLGTISLQAVEDWSGVPRRCAAATVQVSAQGLQAGEEIRLERPHVRVSGFSYSRACEEPTTDADSFSVELRHVQAD